MDITALKAAALSFLGDMNPELAKPIGEYAEGLKQRLNDPVGAMSNALQAQQAAFKKDATWNRYGLDAVAGSQDTRNSIRQDEIDSALNTVSPTAMGSLKFVNQPEFVSWFKGSKVANKDGTPLTVYHGTASDVKNFDPLKSGTKSNTGAPEGTFFFTDKPDIASSYTVKWQGDFSAIPHEGANVMPLHLNIRRPLVVNAKGENWKDILYKGEYYDINELAQLAKNSGKYDGVIVKNVRDKGVGSTTSKTGTTYIAFHPTQVKSAISNNGAFNSSDSNIMNGVAAGSLSPFTNDNNNGLP